MQFSNPLLNCSPPPSLQPQSFRRKFPSAGLKIFRRVEMSLSSSQAESALPPPPDNGAVPGCGAVSVDYLATVAAFPKPDDKIRSTSLKIFRKYQKNLFCVMCNSVTKKRHFEIMCHDKMSLYQRLHALRSASSQFLSSIISHCGPNISSREFKVWKVICWHEKFSQGIGPNLVHVIISMVLIMSLSVSGSKAPTWALSDENHIFLEAWRTVDRAYYDKTFNGQSWFRYRENALRTEPMNNREETYMAIRKMLSTLDDPFTRFLEPEKFKSLRSGTQGSLTGVGLSIGYPIGLDVSSRGLAVISSFPGGPANKASIKPGDMILAIDNQSTEDMDIYEAAELLQGSEGSTVKLDIRSGHKIKHMVLRREKITLNPVKSSLCEVAGLGNDGARIGYIKLESFNQNASGAVRDAIQSLRNTNVTSFVLDLRDNSGGLFSEGIETAKIWLDKGVIVYICDNHGIRDIYETDGSNSLAVSEPLIVLVNRGTASASEILAGALKDNNRAVLYGEPTYGKGKIQSVFELSDGSGLAVTVARYETPGHTSIDKVGITPDHPLPPSFPLDENLFCGCLKDPTSTCNLNSFSFFSR